MSQRIRVDTESLKRHASTNEQISSDIKKVGDKIYQSTSGLNDYGGQLPTKKTALTAQNEAGGISSQVEESSEKLANIAAKFEEVDNALVSSFVAIPEPPFILIPPFYLPPMNENNEISSCGIDFIAFQEDCRYYEKEDGAVKGNCTGGIGHLIHEGPCCGCAKESRFNHMTKEEAKAQMKIDLEIMENIVKTSGITYPLTQAQFDALVSLVFTMGYLPIDIIKRINAGDIEGAAILFGQYIHATDGSLPGGLPSRRERENNLFLNGWYGNEECNVPTNGVRKWLV
jgi:GH24 family phage-related lysozyme (muramidase)